MSLDGVVGGGLAPHHIIEATVKRGGEPDKFNFHSISSTPVVDNDALCIFFPRKLDFAPELLVSNMFYLSCKPRDLFKLSLSRVRGVVKKKIFFLRSD